MFFKDIICIKSPFGQVCGSPFLASYCGNNSGTDMLAQHATSIVSCKVILEHNRRNGRLFFPFPLFVSLTGVDFTRHSRPVFTRHDRSMFTTHRRPVFTTVAESLPIQQWERNTEHGADSHEYLHRNYIPLASWGK